MRVAPATAAACAAWAARPLDRPRRTAVESSAHTRGRLAVPLLSAIVAFLAGLAGGYLLFQGIEARRALTIRDAARKAVDDARAEADRLRAEARRNAEEDAARRREALEEEAARARDEVARLREDLARREAGAQARADTLAADAERHAAREAALAAKEREVAATLARELDELLRVSQLSREEATERLLARLDAEVAAEESARIERALARTTEDADRRAREILAAAVQRVALDQGADTTVTIVEVPSDELKARLVGRDGRNLRAFEEAAGVDLIVDDTPGSVVLSSFDSVRREAARLALEKLLADGRIHPARIEAALGEARREVEDVVADTGRAAALEVGIADLHPEVLAHLGRLHFRQSRGQNVLRHSVEVSSIAGALAGELGLDPRLARRAGLLHDIGRAVDHEVEGGHAAAGAELARRFDEPREVVNAIAAHTDAVPAETPYALLTRAADRLSIDRPGARDDLAARFVRRMRDLETLARSFPGAERAFALAAGGELRVLVDADKTAEKLAAKLARDIAKKIEEELTYPGEVKVTVIRETRAVEYAR
jgi:ribonuclease Y